jgi:hypothetical protein
VEHHYHVGAALERLGIAGFLIAAVAAILRMHVHGQAQAPRHFGRIVARVIVHQDALIHDFGQLADGGFEGLSRVVSRQNDDDALSVNQIETSVLRFSASSVTRKPSAVSLRLPGETRRGPLARNAGEGRGIARHGRQNARRSRGTKVHSPQTASAFRTVSASPTWRR